MPTGYTHEVQTGKVTELNEFIWKCARAFGALVHMRDERSGTKITRPPQSDHYTESLAEAQKDLIRAQERTEEQALTLAQYEHEKACIEHLKQIKETEQEFDRYRAMFNKVKNWQPPTSEHQGLKDFMIQQLTDSAKSDCDIERLKARAPVMMSASDYRSFHIEHAEDNIKYYSKQLEKENKNTDGKNQWVEDLNKSIPCPDSMKGF